MENVALFMFEFWILMMLTIVITNKTVRDNVKEVIVTTKEKIVPKVDNTGVDIITDEMEADLEEGAKNEYFRTRY